MGRSQYKLFPILKSKKESILELPKKPLDQELLDIALSLASEYHKGQKRKNGEDYIQHCIRVADRCSSITLKIIALLHDTLEDTSMTIEILEKYFSVVIVNAIELLTFDKIKMSYVDYIVQLKDNYFACTVKKADILDNLNGATGTLKCKYELALYILNQEEF